MLPLWEVRDPRVARRPPLIVTLLVLANVFAFIG